MSIPNHYSATLSALDLEMVQSVPPGGNWKNIPEHIPSQRLKQIRQGYAAGLGSRSTYYGRLAPDRPAFTITTYFNRPGNGCHIHPDFSGGQHRVISQREAARLQSFPDSFVFCGSMGDINKQIGNAVPPLLAYQLATHLGMSPGDSVDLFCGAGGLSLGFLWAGWRPILAAEIHRKYLQTYNRNVHDQTLQVDLSENEGVVKVVEAVRAIRDKGRPLVLLGGPPCQGFSTAGNRRSMHDNRNQLFKSYARVLELLRPDCFLFENVPGLLSMEGGRVFKTVFTHLEASGYSVSVWDLKAHEFGVPQRRRRIFLFGSRGARYKIGVPIGLLSESKPLFQRGDEGFVTVSDAISDLPRLDPGEDGSTKTYTTSAQTPYQRLMRGQMTPHDFIQVTAEDGHCD